MSIIETELDELKPLAIRVRLAGPRDCEALCDLLDNPAHAREQVLAWLESPGTTLLVAQSELGILGVAVLLTRIVPMPGTAPANGDGGRGSSTARPITSPSRSATSTVESGPASHCPTCAQLRAGPSKRRKKSGRFWRWNSSSSSNRTQSAR